MRFSELIKMIAINLIQNRYKVLLTSLGIVIGTMTIISVLAIGEGGKRQVEEQFKHLSAETIYINYQPPLTETKQQQTERLGLEEIKTIQEENPLIKKMYLRELLYSEIKVSGKKKNVAIVGVTQGYSDISNYHVGVGKDFSDKQLTDGEKVIVIGNNMAKQYFGSAEQAIDQEIIIKGKAYQIIGVLDKLSDGLQGVNPDDTVFTPYATLKSEQLINEHSIPQGVAIATNKQQIPAAMERIRSSLTYLFEKDSLYEIEDAGSRIEAALSSSKTMNLLLISMAVIVFIVSGIGIMNVLFISVNERTKEIGILKALGTSQADILNLFLYESIGIGIIGGLMGILLSLLSLPLLETLDVPIYPSLKGKLIAFFFAVLTATIFGFYPAYKASKLTPVKELNKQ